MTVRQGGPYLLMRGKKARVSLGHGLVGQWVRVCEDESGVTIYYADHPVRALRPEQLIKDRVV